MDTFRQKVEQIPIVTFFESSVSLELLLGLVRVLVQAGALDLQVVDHRLDPPDGHELAVGVVEPDDAVRGLRVLGR